VIEDVAAAIKESLRTESRDFFNRHLAHQYKLTRSALYKPLRDELILLINAFMNWEKSQHAGSMFPFPTGTVFYEQEVKDAVMHGLNKTFLDKKAVENRLFGQFQPAAQKRWNPRVVKVNQHEVQIFLAKGELAATRGKAVGKTKKGEHQPAIDFATQQLYKDARAEALDFLKFPNRGGGKTPSANLPPTYHAPGGKKMPGRSSQQTTPHLVKGHGSVKSKGVDTPLETTGGQQTTVPILAMARDWETFKKKKFTKLHHVSVLKYITGVHEEITDALAVEYDLQSFSADPDITLDDKFIVNLHATDNKGNKVMKHYDKNGIKKYIDTVAAAVHTRMTATLGHLEPHLKGSPTKAERTQKIMAAQLVSSLLKVKSRPDFRLKVNKRLLQEAKDLKKKVKKKQKAKPFQDRKTGKTKKTVKAGSAAAGRLRQKKHGGNRTIDTSKTAQSPIALRNLLNEVLPQQVAKNMTGPPTLQFRTGRFANSARVEMVNMGPRGGIHIDYTYLRDPYETFEPGNKQGSTYRDPKRIIGKSIRDVALGILGKQPTTMRRT